LNEGDSKTPASKVSSLKEGIRLPKRRLRQALSSKEGGRIKKKKRADPTRFKPCSSRKGQRRVGTKKKLVHNPGSGPCGRTGLQTT